MGCLERLELVKVPSSLAKGTRSTLFFKYIREKWT